MVRGCGLAVLSIVELLAPSEFWQGTCCRLASGMLAEGKSELGSEKGRGQGSMFLICVKGGGLVRFGSGFETIRGENKVRGCRDSVSIDGETMVGAVGGKALVEL